MSAGLRSISRSHVSAATCRWPGSPSISTERRKRESNGSRIAQLRLQSKSAVLTASSNRVALAPQTGFNAVSAPIRLVMLSEQTRDWEHGRSDRVFAGVRRYAMLAALGSVVLLPLPGFD